MRLRALALLALAGLASGALRAEEASPPPLPEVTPGEPLSLEEALRLVAARPQLTAQALASLDRAEAALKASWAVLVPTASASLAYTHWDHPVEYLGTIYQKQEDLDGGLLLSVPLVSARSWLAVRTAQTGTQVAELGLAEVRQALLLTVARAYYQALGLRSLVDVQVSQIRASERHLQVATARHRSGTGPRMDVLRARTELVQAREALETSLLGLDNAREALASLTGLAGLPLPVAEADPPAPPAELTRLLELGHQQREDLRLARASQEQADLALDASWMQFVPSLNLAWQFAWQITDPPASAGGFTQDPTRWFLGLTLNIPLFDETRYADLDLRRAELTLAERQAEEAERQAALAIRQAARDRQKSLVLLSAAAERSRLAKETLTLAEEAYRAGTGSSLEVTDARRASQAAEVDLVARRVAAQLILLELWRAVGQDLTALSPGTNLSP